VILQHLVEQITASLLSWLSSHGPKAQQIGSILLFSSWPMDLPRLSIRWEVYALFFPYTYGNTIHKLPDLKLLVRVAVAALPHPVTNGYQQLSWVLLAEQKGIVHLETWLLYCLGENDSMVISACAGI
jgi:hypothetical protein